MAAFVAGRLPFLGIVDTVERVLTEAPTSPNQVPSKTCSRPSPGRGPMPATLIVAAVTEGS